MDFSQPDPYQPTDLAGAAGGDPSVSPEPCHECGQGPARVETYMWVMSFLLMTRHLEYQANLCRACATRTGLREQVKSALVGWWGIPWGLMTFKALWVNARSLGRWSTLPAGLGLATLVAGLLVPAAFGYLAFVGNAETRAARQTGDYVDDEVVALVEKGHEHYAAGRLAEALDAYVAAQRQAPRSSVVNFSVAQTLIDQGRLEEALPYAEQAVEADPESAGHRAMYAYLLTSVSGADAAREHTEWLRRAVPRDEGDAIWMADFFHEIGDHDQRLRAARTLSTARAGAPSPPYLVARELAALVELDRVEEAKALVDGLGQEDLETAEMRFSRDLYLMRTEPAAAAERLAASWQSTPYSPRAMEDLVRAAERGGGLDEARAVLRRVLHAPETPGDVWAYAQPWFADSWAAELDRYLETRPEPMPAFLRLQLYDPVADAGSIRRLSARVDEPAHPVAPLVDIYRFSVASRADRPLGERTAELDQHLSDAPDHALCRYLLTSILVREAPERAALEVQRLAAAADDDPPLETATAVLRAELGIARGDFAAARAEIAEIDPQSGGYYIGAQQIDLVAAEAAFHAADQRLLRQRLGRLIRGEDVASHAAALVVRWSQQLAAGREITYRQDVDELFARHGEAIFAERRGTSLQGILLAEGRIDRREADRAVPPENHITLELVRLFRDAASGEPDLGAFEAIAASEGPGRYAPLLARTAIARRAGRQAA